MAPQLAAALKAMSLWEMAAVLLALAYLVLAIRENIACWFAAILSTSIYIVLMYQAGLYMESALQLFYIAMAIYGWYSWKHGKGPEHELLVSSWPPSMHIAPREKNHSELALLVHHRFGISVPLYQPWPVAHSSAFYPLSRADRDRVSPMAQEHDGCGSCLTRRLNR